MNLANVARHMTLAHAMAALCMGGVALAPAMAAAEIAAPPVTGQSCLATTLAALGGDALHLEFESRAGVPTYEFIVGTEVDEYYVGCNATTGALSEVDVIVGEQDQRWTAVAKVDEAAATKVALDRYKGEVEEVKRLLLSDGSAAYEIDVEVADADGEFNVYVDAATGSLTLVNIEYWEIGRPGSES